jgi:hypothetical protein
MAKRGSFFHKHIADRKRGSMPPLQRGFQTGGTGCGPTVRPEKDCRSDGPASIVPSVHPGIIDPMIERIILNAKQQTGR